MNILSPTERDGADRVRLSVKDVGIGFQPEASLPELVEIAGKLRLARAQKA